MIISTSKVRVYVGCCGFTITRKRYYELFDVVELQETFYNPPDKFKLRKFREEAPEAFIFAMKAWQAITHNPSSPTWRKSKFKVPEGVREFYGDLRPTKENFEAWELIRDAAKELNAKVIVIQTPPSFNFNDTNFRNAREFLSTISRCEFIIGWEVRGDWRTHRSELAEIINMSPNIIHITDPFKEMPVVIKPVTYFRLHGIGKGEVNYRYKYTEDDLRKLLKIVSELSGKSTEVYVLFNNIFMKDDALRFKELLANN